METPSPSPSPAHKLALLKEQIRDCIVSETFQLPLHTYSKRFNFATLSYENCRKSRMVVSLNTIGTLTRLLEIAEVVGALMEKEEFITKRNLYYKLIHYYRNYSLVDDDIELLAFNTGLEREDLRIVSSSRCLLLGGVTLHIDQTQLVCQPNLITHVSSFRTLRAVETTCSTLFIVEKESALHQITQ
jgi:DNA topoisomerase VI subunit A